MNFFCLGKDNVKDKANKQPFITKYYSNELNAMTKNQKRNQTAYLRSHPNLTHDLTVALAKGISLSYEKPQPCFVPLIQNGTIAKDG